MLLDLAVPLWIGDGRYLFTGVDEGGGLGDREDDEEGVGVWVG